MRRLVKITVAAALVLALAAPGWAEPLVLEYGTTAEPLFVPGDNVTARVVEIIGQARKSIRVQAYDITSPQIAQALIAAHDRGVEVVLIANKATSHSKYSVCTMLAQAGVVVYLDGKHRIAHNKVMVIDEVWVLTGSFNWTAAAQKSNAENLLVVRSATLAQRYLANWARHREHSVAWEAR
ncbi:MAG: phospholipase D family protein [Pseudomonadota bacterium]